MAKQTAEVARLGYRQSTLAAALDTTRQTIRAMELRGDEILKLVPYRRMGNPNEIAEMVCWLCSDRASYASGANYNVDGGYAAQ